VKVTVLIDGRDAVPVRAIPFVTGWRLSPDAVAKEFSNLDRPSRSRSGLRAFQFDASDGHPAINPVEWDQILVRLNALDQRLSQSSSGERDEISYALWREQSPSCLPRGCFVWRDEFEAAYLGGRTRAAYHEAHEVLKVNFSPLVPPELESVVMEGFLPVHPTAPASGKGMWPWGEYETRNLRLLDGAARKFWSLYDPKDPSTAPTNAEVCGWLRENGASENLAAAMATILRADGLPTGPRK